MRHGKQLNLKLIWMDGVLIWHDTKLIMIIKSKQWSSKSVCCSYPLTNEDDVVFMKQLRQGRIFRGMTPSGPHSLNLCATSDVQDELDIGVVIVVRATGNRDILVSQTDVLWKEVCKFILRMRLQIHMNMAYEVYDSIVKWSQNIKRARKLYRNLKVLPFQYIWNTLYAKDYSSYCYMG